MQEPIQRMTDHTTIRLARQCVPSLFDLGTEPETFAFDPATGSVIRTVRIRDREVDTRIPVDTSIVGEPPDDLSSMFDKSWLRSASRLKTDSVQRGPHVRVVDLFAGCGGLSLGVSEAVASMGGMFTSVFANDIDAGALSIYSANLQPESISTSPAEILFDPETASKLGTDESDLVEKLRGMRGKIDFLIGGPPCQGHSDLNNHTRRDDPKNELYRVMALAARVLEPRFVIVENVLGARHSSSGVVQRTLTQLNSLGYQTDSITLNAASFGVAQNRKRHFTLAIKTDPKQVTRTIELLQRPARNVMWAIDDLTEEDGRRDGPFYTAATHSVTNSKRIDYLFDNELYELPNEQRPDCHRLKPHSYTSVYGRMRPDAPAPTITSGFGSTGQGRFVHPYKRRTMTPHEAARLQFFPDWFRFDGLGRNQLQQCIGNAVPPKLGYVLALSLLNSGGAS